MFQFIMNGGPFMWLMVVLTGVIVFYFAVFFRQRNKSTSETKTKQLDNIMKLATLIMVFGVLGQIQGIYNALVAIKAAENISPEICLEGFMISFNTTLFGLYVYVLTGLGVIFSEIILNKMVAVIKEK